MSQTDELDRTIVVATSVLFTIATISVLGYLIFGSSICVYAALGVYTFSFSVLTLSSIRKLFQVSFYKERLLKLERSPELSQEEREKFSTERVEIFKVLNKTKRSELTKAIISGVFAIFTIVVLVLF